MTARSYPLSQGDVDTSRVARVSVPGCGRNEKHDAPIVLIEQTKDGNITLKVYADILSTEATHEISLNGAKLEKKPAPVKEVANG